MLPLVNLKRQIESIRPQLDEAYCRVVDSGQFVGGSEVKDFEAKFAEEMGVKYGVACSNGTAALLIALDALGVGPGDEVITSTHTFIATIEAIIKSGAKPVLVDVAEGSPNMDLVGVEKSITKRTKAIIPVHLYGVPVDMKHLMSIARKYSLFVIEDCSQAHLAEFAGTKVGAFGHIGAFSLFPAKNLGALGDGGVLVTNDSALRERMSKTVDHGRQDKYKHDLVGFNFRLDPLQAAFLSVKLPYLKGWVERRRQVASAYNEILGAKVSDRVQTFNAPAGGQSAYHLFVVRVPAQDRDKLVSLMNSRDIQVGVHYPIPCHLQPALRDLGYVGGQFPRAEALADSVMSLPICGSITDDEVMTVANTFVELVRGGSGVS